MFQFSALLSNSSRFLVMHYMYMLINSLNNKLIFFQTSQFVNYVNSSCESHAVKLNEYYETVNNSFKTSKQTIAKTMADFESLRTHFHACLTQSDATMKFLQAHSENLDSTQQLAQTRQSEILTSVSHITSDATSTLVANINANSVQNKEVHASTETEVAKLSTVHKGVTTKFMGSINEMEAEFGRQSEEFNDKLSTMIDGVNAINETTEMNISAGLIRVIDDIQNENERCLRCHDDEVELHQQLEATQSNASGTLHTIIDVSGKRLETFRRSELRVYDPTGKENFL